MGTAVEIVLKWVVIKCASHQRETMTKSTEYCRCSPCAGPEDRISQKDRQLRKRTLNENLREVWVNWIPQDKWDTWGQSEPHKENPESRSVSASNVTNATEWESVAFHIAAHMPGLSLRDSKGWDLEGAGGTEVRLLPSFDGLCQHTNHNIPERQWCLGFCLDLWV